MNIRPVQGKGYGVEKRYKHWSSIWQSYLIPRIEVDSRCPHLSDGYIEGEFEPLKGMGRLLLEVDSAPKYVTIAWQDLSEDILQIRDRRGSISRNAKAFAQTLEHVSGLVYHPQGYFLGEPSPFHSLMEDIDIRKAHDFTGGILQMLTFFDQFLPTEAINGYDAALRSVKNVYANYRGDPGSFHAALWQFREYVMHISWPKI